MQGYCAVHGTFWGYCPSCHLYGQPSYYLPLYYPYVWPMPPSMSVGWQCPVCGRCFAPTTPKCDHCGGV